MKPGIKPTNYQVQAKIFEAAGCTYVLTQGDHLVYHYPGAKRPVVIPKYKQEQYESYRYVGRRLSLTPSESLMNAIRTINRDGTLPFSSA